MGGFHSCYWCDCESERLFFAGIDLSSSSMASATTNLVPAVISILMHIYGNMVLIFDVFVSDLRG